jgi:hypothetical protein
MMTASQFIVFTWCLHHAVDVSSNILDKREIATEKCLWVTQERWRKSGQLELWEGEDSCQ